jgi:hypothetical protein
MGIEYDPARRWRVSEMETKPSPEDLAARRALVERMKTGMLTTAGYGSSSRRARRRSTS